MQGKINLTRVCHIDISLLIFLIFQKRGRFSVILKGINTSNDSIAVAKLLEITPDTESRVTHEFNVLKSLKHERIAYLIEAFK